MMGVPDDPENAGLIPNCFNHIFGVINTEEDKTKKFLIRCSYLEIYNEDVFDLLTERPKGKQLQKLDIKEDKNKGVYVNNLKTIVVHTIEEIEQAMIFGTNNRKTASTNMNDTSSRSHSIFTIYIETAVRVEN
jgi:hypothetical protein